MKNFYPSDVETYLILMIYFFHLLYYIHVIVYIKNKFNINISSFFFGALFWYTVMMSVVRNLSSGFINKIFVYFSANFLTITAASFLSSFQFNLSICHIHCWHYSLPIIYENHCYLIFRS